MEYLTLDTKKGANLYGNYRRATCGNLWDAYEKPSRAKVNAFFDCQNIRQEYNGTNERIISHNTFTFTYGFEYASNVDGVCHCVIITPTYEYDIELSTERTA